MKEFVLNNWYYILYCLVYVIVFTIIIIKYIKAKKNAKTTQELAVAREDLKSSINILIQEAEKFSHFKGEEKKNYVMTRSIQLSNGLMSNEEIDNYIEEQVALTNKVNKHNR